MKPGVSVSDNTEAVVASNDAARALPSLAATPEHASGPTTPEQASTTPEQAAVTPEQAAGPTTPERDAQLDCEKEMPALEHLAELRGRIVSSLVCWILATCLAYGEVPHVLALIRGLSGDGFRFVYTSPSEAFMAFVQLAMVCGAIVCLPIFLYHTVVFINPGLTRRERRWLVALLPVALGLFALGVSFAWYVVIPVTWRFFLSFQSDSLQALWSIGDVIGFVAGTLLLCGVIFQLPLLMVLLALLGLVQSAKMAGMRRVLYFASFVIAAVVTPTPDAFTAALVALPLILLFELSLLFIRLCGR